MLGVWVGVIGSCSLTPEARRVDALVQEHGNRRCNGEDRENAALMCWCPLPTAEKLTGACVAG